MRLLIIIIISFLLFAWLEYEPPRAEKATGCIANKSWLQKRMKYHGIDGCVCENGNYYFYRGGKKCKL